MSPISVESSEMTAKEQSNPNENDSGSALVAPRWSVVSFESVAVSGISYAEAAKWMEKLYRQKVSGLCIITDEAAARISKQKLR